MHFARLLPRRFGIPAAGSLPILTNGKQHQWHHRDDAEIALFTSTPIYNGFVPSPFPYSCSARNRAELAAEYDASCWCCALPGQRHWVRTWLKRYDRLSGHQIEQIAQWLRPDAAIVAFGLGAAGDGLPCPKPAPYLHMLAAQTSSAPPFALGFLGPLAGALCNLISTPCSNICWRGGRGGTRRAAARRYAGWRRCCTRIMYSARLFRLTGADF
jgi:hypothetical protein